MAVFFDGAVVVSAAAVTAWYYFRLLPQQRQLTSILTRYRKAAGEE